MLTTKFVKIFENKYIDFATLIFPFDENDTLFRVSMIGTGLGLTAQQKPNRSIPSIFQWNQAFDIFMAI